MSKFAAFLLGMVLVHSWEKHFAYRLDTFLEEVNNAMNAASASSRWFSETMAALSKDDRK